MTNQVTVRETQVMDALALQTVKDQLSSLLNGNSKKIEAFKATLLKVSLSYGLDKCSPESIIKCGIQALSLDLPLEAGQGYIVNYGGQAAFDAGYKGWQVLVKRAGYSVLADAVYLCDEFSQDGFGFDRQMVFKPDLSQRNSADDVWAKENLAGVIVSIMEDDTGIKTHAFVAADMIHKIAATSPSQQSDKGKKFSPHSNWAEQMFMAKAIKQVLSKFAIDLSKSSQLNEAIQIINETEQTAQAEAVQQNYPQERFNELMPQWVELVRSGKRKAMAIVTQLSNAYTLTPEQLEEVMMLKSHEPIEGEATNA